MKKHFNSKTGHQRPGQRSAIDLGNGNSKGGGKGKGKGKGGKNGNKGGSNLSFVPGRDTAPGAGVKRNHFDDPMGEGNRTYGKKQKGGGKGRDRGGNRGGGGGGKKRGPQITGANREGAENMRTFNKRSESPKKRDWSPPAKKVTVGRGRGLTMPAWMKNGVGSASTTTDVQPSIPSRDNNRRDDRRNNSRRPDSRSRRDSRRSRSRKRSRSRSISISSDSSRSHKHKKHKKSRSRKRSRKKSRSHKRSKRSKSRSKSHRRKSSRRKSYSRSKSKDRKQQRKRSRSMESISPVRVSKDDSTLSAGYGYGAGSASKDSSRQWQHEKGDRTWQHKSSTNTNAQQARESSFDRDRHRSPPRNDGNRHRNNDREDRYNSRRSRSPKRERKSLSPKRKISSPRRNGRSPSPVSKKPSECSYRATTNGNLLVYGAYFKNTFLNELKLKIMTFKNVLRSIFFKINSKLRRSHRRLRRAPISPMPIRRRIRIPLFW